MTLDVPREYEGILREAVACGRFTDERAALLHALTLLAEQQEATMLPIEEGASEGESAFEAFSRQGVIGCMKPGPADLATNPEHMNGFGR